MNKRFIKLTLLFLNGAALFFALIWLYRAREWEPLVTSLGLVATLVAIARMNETPAERGRGGNAITAGENAVLEIENTGHISAGKGGLGGNGGDAIQASPGVTLKIVNRGRIVGGDAGASDSHGA